MSEHFRSNAVIFGCIPRVNFHLVVALFQLNSRERSNSILTLISPDVKNMLFVTTFVSRLKAGKVAIFIK